MNQEFKKWLQDKGMVQKTIDRKANHAVKFLDWLQDEKLDILEVDYPVMMNYIGVLRKTKSSQLIREILKALEQYFDYLQLDNPIKSIRIRKPAITKTPLFSKAELQQLYDHFTPEIKGNNKGYYHLTDKLILGLILFQALDMPDIYRLEIKDLNLEKGKIYIKGSAKGNSRILSLESQQVLPLHHYIFQVRNQLMAKETSTNFKADGKASDKLFIPQCIKQIRLRYQWRKLALKVKEQALSIEMEVIRLQQLRQSCMANWIKEHGIRKAQYMAGLTTISGMERYQDEGLEDLQKLLNELHPLK